MKRIEFIYSMLFGCLFYIASTLSSAAQSSLLPAYGASSYHGLYVTFSVGDAVRGCSMSNTDSNSNYDINEGFESGESSLPYLIRYYVNGEEYYVDTLYKGCKIVLPEDPNPYRDSMFIGWDPEVPDIMPGTNLSFSAVYEYNVRGVVAHGPYCPGEDAIFEYIEERGVNEITGFRVIFQEQSKKLGFKDTEYMPVEYLSRDTARFTLTIPSGMYGDEEVSAFVQFKYNDETVSPYTVLVFYVNVNSNQLILKMNRSLTVDQTFHKYKNFVWYKDDEVIEGATGDSYSCSSGLNGFYKVIATKPNKETAEFCGRSIYTQNSIAKGFHTYPVPARVGQDIYITVDGFDDEVVENSRIEIYDVEGQSMIKVIENVQTVNSVRLHTGIYVVVFRVDKKRIYTSKLVVYGYGEE